MTVICLYCNKEAALVGGDVIYKHRPDLASKKFYFCAPCDAFVGTHRATGVPLGSLAKPELRKLRGKCHALFDPIWKNKHMKRTSAYKWLAESLEIPAEKCHIGMFNQVMCKKAINLLKLKRAEMKC